MLYREWWLMPFTGMGHDGKLSREHEKTPGDGHIETVSSFAGRYAPAPGAIRTGWEHLAFLRDLAGGGASFGREDSRLLEQRTQ